MPLSSQTFELEVDREFGMLTYLGLMPKGKGEASGIGRFRCQCGRIIRAYIAQVAVSDIANCGCADPQNFWSAKNAAHKSRIVTEEQLINLAKLGYAPHICVAVSDAYLFDPDKILSWLYKNLMTSIDGKDFPKRLNVIAPPLPVNPNEVPKPLYLLSRSLSLFTGPSYPPCVYFHLFKGEIVYMGQTIDLVSRTASHRTEKASYPYDTILYLAVPEPSLLEVEAAFIRALVPRYNSIHNSGALRPRDLETLTLHGFGEFADPYRAVVSNPSVQQLPTETGCST